jgi:hypothetical protein
MGYLDIALGCVNIVLLRKLCCRIAIIAGRDMGAMLYLEEWDPHGIMISLSLISHQVKQPNASPTHQTLHHARRAIDSITIDHYHVCIQEAAACPQPG